MRIDVRKIKSEIQKLSVLLDTYEDNYLNIYNEMLKVSSAWKDGVQIKFEKNVLKEKAEVQNSIAELRSIENVYKYLIQKYENIGNKIYFEEKNKDSLLLKIDDSVWKINSILTSYKNLDLSFCPEVAHILLNQKQKLINDKDKLLTMKKKIKNMFNYINDVEVAIKSKISKIEIDLFIENDINIYF